MQRIRFQLLVLQIAFLAAGACLTARPAYRWAKSRIRKAHAQYLWQQCRDSKYDPGPGKPTAWLRIPATGVSTLVVSGVTEKDLLAFPCLLSDDGTIGPGGGMTIISAHRDRHFRALKDIRCGNRIDIELPDSIIVSYRVLETEIITPDRAFAHVREKRREDWLVLMTCYPFQYIGPAPKRFLVWARPEAAI